MRVEEAEVKGVEEVREAEVEAEVGREGRWRAGGRRRLRCGGGGGRRGGGCGGGGGVP